MSFDRLIRFLDRTGKAHYGNLSSSLDLQEIEGTEVHVVTGSIDAGFQVTSEKTQVVNLLPPIDSTPVVLCAGVNYKSHSRETKFKSPKKPVIFATPSDRLAGALEDIPIPEDAQSLLDYEGELTLVISKDCKDVSEDKALDYVLGYTVGNDVSARNYNDPDVSGWQMGYAKSFDKFGPLGPYLVSPKLVPNPQDLHLITKVNGHKRQETSTSEMIWSCRQLIAFCSNGRTLRAGSVIMTGTPEGVGWHSNGCLKDGDVVEVAIDGLGSTSNRMVFG